MPVKTASMTAGRMAAAWLPAGLWMALIFYLSAQERPPEVSQAALVNILAHFGEYVLLASLIIWGQFFSGWWKGRPLLAPALAFAAAVLYAASDEYHQGFVPTRDASLADFAVDAARAASAVVAIWLWARGLLWRRARYRRTSPIVRRIRGAP